MEFFLELVGELLLEGCLAVGSNKKNSKWVRYPLLAVVYLFYLAVTGMFIALTVRSLWEGKTVLFLVLLAVDCGILALLIHIFRKQRAQNKK